MGEAAACTRRAHVVDSLLLLGSTLDSKDQSPQGPHTLPDLVGFQQTIHGL